jgi:hypothetical protein
VPVARDVIKAYFDKKAPEKAEPEPLQTQARAILGPALPR